MQIAVLGINHKCADVSLREQIAKSIVQDYPFPHVLLSTCNRTEIYFSSSDMADTHSLILGTLKELIPDEFEHRLYAYFGTECFIHLAKVTAGLDSAILGETEIQGQVKAAYEKAPMVCLELHFLFQKALHLAKHVRTTMPLTTTQLEDTVLRLCSPFRKVLFIGLSAINRRLIKALKTTSLVSLSNRTEDKAFQFAHDHGLIYCPWNSWQGHDALIFGTTSPTWLLTASDSIDARLVVDLSVPRNVDPHLATRLNLINIDQINERIQNTSTAIHPGEELVRVMSLRYIEAFFKRREAKQLMLVG